MLAPIVVSKSDYDRLAGLIAVAEHSVSAIVSLLRSEMQRALVLPAQEVPPEVVRMGSSVVYSLDDAAPKRAVLVFPETGDEVNGRVSILTMLGAALIGLSPGQCLAWRDGPYHLHKVCIIAVESPLGAGSRLDSTVVNVAFGRKSKTKSPPSGDDPGPQAA